MAAYAALVSLMHIIDTIEHHHSPPISIHKQQVESLTLIVTFLQEFLESYKSPVADGDEADPLEMRIADAAYAAEDVIESHIVDKLQLSRSKVAKIDTAYIAEDAVESHIVDKVQLRRSKEAKISCFFNCFGGSKNDSSNHDDEHINLYQDHGKKEAMETAAAADEGDVVGEDVSCIDFYEDLQQVIEEMNVIKKEAMETAAEAQLQRKEFLEGYKSPVADGDEADPLEMRIVDAAHAVEDVIESHIVNVIKLGRSSPNKIFLQGYVVDAAHGDEEVNSREEVSFINFYQDLQQVIEEMNVIKKEAMETSAESQLQRKVSSTRAGSLTSSSTVKESMMVGFDDVQLQLLDKLTGGNRNRQIIPITGMGGIGKTTLARHIFEHALVNQHFDIRAWTTISQTYNVRETLREVLHQASGDSRNDLSDENELGENLYKYLWGRRYLIILDDMWSVEVWYKIRFFFPDYNDGSRVIVTTRLSNLAAELTNSNSIGMRFLDDVCSWSLFSKTVFGDEVFPLHLEEIGKKIVGKCKGLPLSIAVIGGLLAKSELTLEYWERIEKNLSSIVNSENDEYCLRVLKLSYDHLPAYLKPCFLYMGTFGEDKQIGVSELMRLWVSEGFLKPIINKSSKTIAKEYLKELVDRNLILVHKLGKLGNIKYCKMHDLLRDLSFQEAEKQRFYYVLGQHCPQGINSQRRIVITRSTSDEIVSQRSRSFICGAYTDCRLLDFRFLRTLTTTSSSKYLEENVFQLVNLRYLSREFREGFQIPSSISLMWNLQTLIVTYKGELTTAPVEIWKMHQLKHLEIVGFRGMYLPDPGSGHSDVMMENLETLKGVIDFNLNEEVVKRIPNIKKLYIRYRHKVMDRVKCLSYLQCLSKLESLKCDIGYGCYEYLQSISFPHSLKKLFLECGDFFHLEEILEKIGSLPLLEKLQLFLGRFATRSWEIVEGQFPSLKYLKLWKCRDMECWNTLEGSCLPRLEQLHLWGMASLEEFPSEIGEIATLKSIELWYCSESAVVSLKKIVEEQEELQGDSPFHVIVRSSNVSQELQRLATPNFRVVKR
ncbi:putative late blight resistance protein homolog R1C-3 isoform X2 [Salvia miltiorrhiza]|uniref:putative late blight resistance protein homolog R1C-3 isoform X2 n=1 Tax=Salvia miltiorrhiza TaxID=226208 RepID=UPI0025AD7EAF|nr:putative late blight resistance protein homolog R1C-3 isoform X2 [Salvia miltiorrhiza]